MRNKKLKIFFLCGIVGPVFYFALLIVLGAMWDGYDPVSIGMSELGAVNSPFKNLMNYLGFSMLGIFILLFGFGFRLYFQKSFQMAISFVLLSIGGASMFLVGFLPCDSMCIDVTLTGRLHSFISTVPAILIPLAAMNSAYPISKMWSKKWGYASFYLGILSMIAGPLMFLEFMHNFSGLVQRLGIGFSLLWIFIVSLKIYREIKGN